MKGKPTSMLARLFILIPVFALLLAACAPAATPTAVPKPTEAPKPAAPATVAPAPKPAEAAKSLSKLVTGRGWTGSYNGV